MIKPVLAHAFILWRLPVFTEAPVIFNNTASLSAIIRQVYAELSTFCIDFSNNHEICDMYAQIIHKNTGLHTLKYTSMACLLMGLIVCFMIDHYWR
ncbi:MAG TPA: hypothetical protein DDY37_02845 [Legionella sp.]|nr:hypothetical protein [Legionella sp.]